MKVIKHLFIQTGNIRVYDYKCGTGDPNDEHIIIGISYEDQNGQGESMVSAGFTFEDIQDPDIIEE